MVMIATRIRMRIKVVCTNYLLLALGFGSTGRAMIACLIPIIEISLMAGAELLRLSHKT